MEFRYQKGKEMSFEKALSTEWLETNGLGGYASSTIVNCHTRKYHGLLVSKLDGLPNKYVLFSKLEDVLIQDGKENFLTAHGYPNFLQDGSFANLEEFALTTSPSWRFQFGNIVLIKEILLLHEENTILLKYKISGGDKNSKLTLCPLLACRDFHKLQQENSSLEQETKLLSTGFSCEPYKGLPVLYFQTNTEHQFLSRPLWYRDFIYNQEQERGYDFQEDLFSPGIITFSDLADETEIIFSCSLVQQQEKLAARWKQEMRRRIEKVASLTGSALQQQLQKVGQSFITKDPIKLSYAVVAGYHWFLEWGRDTMISLPGLTLHSGQEDLCVEILNTFVKNEHQGLIPNYLGKTKAENAYNSVDASLWFAWTVQQYYLKTKKIKIVAEYFWPVLKNIFTWYKRGTLYQIKMQADGLLCAGSPEINLTWMDAMLGDTTPVTPRHGLQVEVNALWFNMLSFMEELAVLLEDPIAQELKELVPKIKTKFCETFWCEEKGYLYDVVNAERKDATLRPNQIFAVSLPYSPLFIKMAVSIMEAVKNNLLTPYGLRTLAPNDKDYVGLYAGDQNKRDLAYHNGTVWPWLLGAFTEGLLRTTSDRRKVLEIIKPCLIALHAHLTEYGIGSIAEVFSGSYPYRPNGCISQAWSVAEVLRLTYILNLDK